MDTATGCVVEVVDDVSADTMYVAVDNALAADNVVGDVGQTLVAASSEHDVAGVVVVWEYGDGMCCRGSPGGISDDIITDL